MSSVYRKYTILTWCFLAIAAATALSLHVAISFAVAAYTQYYYQSRMFDVRRYPGEGRELIPLSVAYAASMVTHNDHVLLGSSFTFSYSYDQNETVATALRDRGFKVRNLSVIGVNLRSMNEFVCGLAARRVEARTLIIEIPLINEVGPLAKLSFMPSLPECTQETFNSSVFHFALTHPIGLGWINFLFDPYRGKASPEKVELSPVPKGYYATPDAFARIEPALKERLVALYQRAKSISPNVLMFVTPVYLDGIAKVANEYHASVWHQFGTVQNFCKKLAAENCIDTTSLTGNPDYFANMTHFKRRGSEALAALIAGRLATERR